MISAAIAKHLAATVAGLTYSEAGGGNVFVNRLPTDPDEAVGVFDTGGFEQPTRAPTDLPTVQVRVRGPERRSRPAHERASDVCAALACLDLVTLDEGGPDEVRIVSCDLLQSRPNGLGMDGSERFEFTVNAALRVHAPTALRPPIPA